MGAMDASVVRPNRSLLLLLLFTALLFLGMPDALAHAVAEGDKGFIQESSGVMVLPCDRRHHRFLGGVQGPG